MAVEGVSVPVYDNGEGHILWAFVAPASSSAFPLLSQHLRANI